MTAELLGLSEDDVEIEFRNRRLTLRAEKIITHEDGEDLRVSERSCGRFGRTMMLPVTVDIENTTAEFGEDVLHILMPKTEPEEPSRKVKIKTK